jgi:hypothetical protein
MPYSKVLYPQTGRSVSSSMTLKHYSWEACPLANGNMLLGYLERATLRREQWEIMAKICNRKPRNYIYL